MKPVQRHKSIRFLRQPNKYEITDRSERFVCAHRFRPKIKGGLALICVILTRFIQYSTEGSAPEQFQY